VDAKPPAAFEGSMDWRKLLDGWLKVADDSNKMHYDAQRHFDKRGSWIGGCAALLTTLTGATAIKQISAGSPDPLFKWIIAGLATLAAVLTALHTFLGDEARAAKHRSTAAGYAAALRKIDENLTFGHSSAADAQKAADAIRTSLDSLSRDAPEVPAGILKKYWSNPPLASGGSAK
jgi:hypothetical protein